MAGSDDDWFEFDHLDPGPVIDVVEALSPSDHDSVVAVEPVPAGVKKGLLGKRRDAQSQTSATICKARGYSDPDSWLVYLTFPRGKGGLAGRGVAVPAEASIESTTKSDACVRFPSDTLPGAVLQFAMEAVAGMTDEPATDRWRARHPSLQVRWE